MPFDAEQKLKLIAQALENTGDMIFMNAQGYPNRLGVGSSGQVLVVSGGVPTWGAGFSTFVSPNADWLQWRNAGDSADIDILRVNASDQTELNYTNGTELQIQHNKSRVWSFNSSGDFVNDLTNGGNILVNRATKGVKILRGLSIDADVDARLGADRPFYAVGDAGSGLDVGLISVGNDTNGVRIQCLKTRATSTNANTIVQSGDQLGGLYAAGADGAVYQNAGSISCVVDGAPGSGSMPAAWEVSTTPSGSGTPLRRWRFDSTGVFTQDATNGGGISLTKTNTSVAQPAASGISAAGSVITDATDLAVVYNNVTTVGAGQGVQLWDAPVGTSIIVRNGGANALNVYPHGASGVINGGGAGAAVSVAAGSLGTFTRVTSGAGGIWIASEAVAA